ncbi:MAG: DUF1902 domain-containing protein [Defluviitaleaceae bacterium]|nr:DUF1902 domain-containing protein [Defluviitaleaceae bacterium]
MMSEYRITFTWDNEAFVWIATSEDIHGLILEHSSFDTLVERVRQAVPELLSLEGRDCDNIALDYGMFRKERLATSG